MMEKNHDEVIRQLRDQVREMHDMIEGMHELIDRLRAGASVNRYTARIELAIEPTYLPDGRGYYLGPPGPPKKDPMWHEEMVLRTDESQKLLNFNNGGK